MPLKSGHPCCPCGSHLLCWYAWNRYKTRYACFGCRKAFKRREQDEVDPGGEHRDARCPDCGGPMVAMGLGFRPPPRRQVRQWQALRSLVGLGIGLQCCCGPSQPRRMHGYRRLVEESAGRGRQLTSSRPTRSRSAERAGPPACTVSATSSAALCALCGS